MHYRMKFRKVKNITSIIQHPSNLYVNSKISEYEIDLFVLFIYFYIHFFISFWAKYYSIISAGTEEGEDSTQTTSRLLPSHRCHVIQHHLPSSSKMISYTRKLRRRGRGCAEYPAVQAMHPEGLRDRPQCGFQAVAEPLPRGNSHQTLITTPTYMNNGIYIYIFNVF